MTFQIFFGADGWGLLLLRGTLVTLFVAIVGMAIGLLLGTLGAFCKIGGGGALSKLTAAYTVAIRGIPELIVIYIFYFGSSNVLSAIAGLFGGRGFFGAPGMLMGALAIGFIAGALSTEVLRSAFRATSPGERLAARACGMSSFLMFRRIVVPTVLRHAIPGLGNVWIGALKESSLVSATGVADLMRNAQAAADSTGLPFTFYVAASFIYIVLALGSGVLILQLERYFAVGGAGHGR